MSLSYDGFFLYLSTNKRKGLNQLCEVLIRLEEVTDDLVVIDVK